MELLGVCYEFGHGEDDLHVVALSFYVADFLVEFLLVLFYCSEYAVFDLGVEMDGKAIVIFELFVGVFDFSLGVPDDFI